MKTETLENLLSYIASECTKVDREARFDAMLNECYSFEKVGGPFAYMSPSSVLKECDPTAYRCGVNDWADGEDLVEVESETYDRKEVEEARDTFVADMEDAASALESEIDREEAEDEPDLEELRKMHAELNERRADIAEAEKYTF